MSQQCHILAESLVRFASSVTVLAGMTIHIRAALAASDSASCQKHMEEWTRPRT